jgi:small subunit ribosomal protein S1
MTDEKNSNEEELAEESFAELFAASYKDQGRLKPGEQMQARVLKISGEWVFLDIGQKGEGVLDRKEVLDAEGNPTVAEGDTMKVWFVGGTRGELRFTTKVGGAGGAGNAMLEDAWRSGIPVEGYVEKEVKGGFEVKIGGTVRAFCPYSLIALRRVEQAADFVGKHLTFRINDYAEGGRNIVLSRRALLEDEARQEKEKLKETLQVGMTVTGTVTTIRDFGAFVRVGAIDGLLPISELGWSRVKEVSEVLQVGQEISVVIKQLDWENNKFSFSLKDTLTDPWDAASEKFPVGSFQTGKVARLAQFGAFVTLGDGIDGLIHISRLGGGKKINHAREVLQEGQMVEVQIEGIDRDNRRISLALADIVKAAREAEEEMTSFRQQAAEAPTGMGTLGDLLKAKLTGKK